MGLGLGLLGGIPLLVGGLWGAFEARYRTRPADALEIDPKGWNCDRSDSNCYRLSGKMVASNHNPIYEVTLAEVTPQITLLGKGDLSKIDSKITLKNPDFPRSDSYYSATLISPKETLELDVEVELRGENLSQLTVAWLQMNFIQYGRQVRRPKSGHLILPLCDPKPTTEEDWQQKDGALVLPIRTQLLTNQDSLANIFSKYAKEFYKDGDYLVLAETATAIVENNFRYPDNIQPGWLAQRLCFFFPSKTSLCSAHGMQALIDTSSSWQVGFAFVVGAIGKILGQSGVFYSLAGYQAALIDDVTGTIQPYEKFIVYGPAEPAKTVATVKAATGVETVIVDANDLKEVKILAATDGIVPEVVFRALRENPAGNADEQTPVLLIRPQ